MHLADAFIQSDLQCIQAIHFLSVCTCICIYQVIIIQNIVFIVNRFMDVNNTIQYHTEYFTCSRTTAEVSSGKGQCVVLKQRFSCIVLAS